jgi:hypothetical protein
MSLPPDIQNYRKLKLAFNPQIPIEIDKRWLNRIIANDLQLLGEKGAEAYLARFGRNISEEKVVHLAIKAEREEFQDMADGFWKKAYSIQPESSTPKARKIRNSTPGNTNVEPKHDGNDRMLGNVKSSMSVVIGKGSGASLIKGEDKHSLREWWHEILRTHGRYSCYGIFLTLPSDVEAFRYLTEYGKELNLIASKNCLIIVLGKTDFQRTGFDEGSWRKLVEEHTSDGYSITVARLFGIKIIDFPCLILFQDIRSPEHVVIKLSNMTAEEIALRMRLIFTTVEDAIRNKKKLLHQLEKQQSIEFIQKTGYSITSKIGGLAEKTFEKAMEAWINATIK